VIERLSIANIAVSILSILSIYYILSKGKNYIYYVLIYNILIDVLSLFAPPGGFIAIVRGVVLFTFFFYVFMNFNKANIVVRIIIIYSIYAFILVLFSSKFLYSFRTYTKIIISILYFWVGYSVIVDINQLKKLTKSIIWVMLIMIVNTLVVNSLGYKNDIYGENQLISSGNLEGQTWNIATYCLLLLPLINHFERIQVKRYIIYSVSFVLFVMMLFNLSRIPLISFLFGYFIFFVFIKYKKKIFDFLILVLFFGIILNIFIWDTYLKQIEIRSGSYELGSYKKEGRYLETFYVFDEIFSFESITKSLFGKEFLNSPGNYANGKFGNRQLHSDYNNLLHGSGIIGLLLYLAIFMSIYRKYFVIKKYLPKNDSTVDLLKSIFHVFFFVPFVISISGQMYDITFRLIDFLFLGAILRVLTNLSHVKLHESIRFGIMQWHQRQTGSIIKET
jgi:hypothetical protein